MTQLKTLKDIKWLEGAIIKSNTDLLKQEAIKWIKELQSRNHFTIPDGERTNLVFDKNEVDAMIWWIKYFHNISEEDLE